MAVTHQRDGQRAGGGGELQDAVICTAPGFLDTSLGYAA